MIPTEVECYAGHKADETPRRFLSSLQDVLQEHSLGAEEGTIEGDCVTHRADEAGAIAVEERDDHLFELVSMAQPVTPSMQLRSTNHQGC